MPVHVSCLSLVEFSPRWNNIPNDVWITPLRVSKIIAQIDTSSTSGPNHIPITVLKYGLGSRLSFFLYLKTLLTVLTPVNYWPINLLSVVSKMFEFLNNYTLVLIWNFRLLGVKVLLF